MEDGAIIQLYFDRSEDAIAETKNKYGSSINYAAYSILNNKDDADECENDTYLAAWNEIPPEVPIYLNGYLCKISRNKAMHSLRSYAKLQRNINKIQTEMTEIITQKQFEDEMIDSEIIKNVINTFLGSQSADKRIIFIGRYWGMKSVEELSEMTAKSKGSIKNILLRMRQELKKMLVSSGVLFE